MVIAFAAAACSAAAAAAVAAAAAGGGVTTTCRSQSRAPLLDNIGTKVVNDATAAVQLAALAVQQLQQLPAWDNEALGQELQPGGASKNR